MEGDGMNENREQEECERKKSSFNRNIVIAVAVLCVVLALSLVGAVANYSSILNEKDSQINDLISAINSKDSQISDLQNQIASDNSTINSLSAQIANLQSQVSSDNATITDLQTQVASANSQINSLNSEIATLQSQVGDLTAIINMSKSKLKTLVFHACEKGEGYEWGHLPNVNYTYNQILTLNNNTYEILLLPEYKGNENWTETLAWIRENFAQIPIMLSVFEGGNYDYPIEKLTIDQISEAMVTCDVRWLRLAEMVSWYMEHQQPFPTEYVTSILNFCRQHNLKLFWTEWKIGDNVFQKIQTYIAGFEDIVTISFSTNSEDLEPADGFMLMSTMFQHWGGSVQSWYWKTRVYGSELDMPISMLIQHALSAKNIGVEILQFEPYWYFFDNGEARENLKLLEIMLS
jgi:uncharacterized coiled-coil protein SlyX